MTHAQLNREEYDQLRDHFAGCALTGLAARMDHETVRKWATKHAEGREAMAAYALADALLAERDRKEPA